MVTVYTRLTEKRYRSDACKSFLGIAPLCLLTLDGESFLIEITRKTEIFLSHNLRNVSLYYLELRLGISVPVMSSFSFTSRSIFVNFEKLEF